MNADHAKTTINLIENSNVKYMVDGNHSIFFKVERKSVVAQALRISKFNLNFCYEELIIF